MAKYPGLLLWTDAWIADTYHLTVELRGVYMDLLILMWRTSGCRVPNDDKWLARHLGYTADQITNLVRPIITEFVTMVAGGDFVTQKRLQREFAHASGRKEKAALAARARWTKKKGNGRALPPSPAPAPAPAHSTVTGAGDRTDPRSLASALPKGALAREEETPPPFRDLGNDYRSPPRAKSDNVLTPLPDKPPIAAKRSTSEE
jgi:uncharacterized protein YdaU (DUF1376 family)